MSVAQRLAATIVQTASGGGVKGGWTGEPNYAITRLIQQVPCAMCLQKAWDEPLRYWIYAQTVGALTRMAYDLHGRMADDFIGNGLAGVFEDVKDEYKRRVNSAYEAAQILKSGDCYEYSPFQTQLVAATVDGVAGYQEVMLPRGLWPSEVTRWMLWLRNVRTPRSVEPDYAAGPAQLVELSHPLVKHHITQLRSVDTCPAEFRRLVHRLAVLLAYEATSDLPIDEHKVQTPLAETTGGSISERIALDPDLAGRSGHGRSDFGFDPAGPGLAFGHLSRRKDGEAGGVLLQAARGTAGSIRR